jgi:hypothetical protein
LGEEASAVKHTGDKRSGKNVTVLIDEGLGKSIGVGIEKDVLGLFGSSM